jgi:hypothetical protein
VVSVLAIGPSVCGFNLAEGDGYLRMIKICNMPSFGGEVKPLAPCHEILWHVKGRLLVGLSESSGAQIRSFPLSISFHMVLHAHISPGG